MDPELQRQQAEIDADRGRLELRQRELNGKKTQWYEDQHERLKSECRQAKAELDQLEHEREAAKAAWVRAEGSRQDSERHLAEHGLVGVRSWPSREELATLESKREELQTKRRDAEEAVSTTRQEYDRLIHACRAARERLDDASRKEYECCTKLGPARHDSGFSITAQDGDSGITMTRTA